MSTNVFVGPSTDCRNVTATPETRSASLKGKALAFFREDFTTISYDDSAVAGIFIENDPFTGAYVWQLASLVTSYYTSSKLGGLLSPSLYFAVVPEVDQVQTEMDKIGDYFTQEADCNGVDIVEKDDNSNLYTYTTQGCYYVASNADAFLYSGSNNDDDGLLYTIGCPGSQYVIPTTITFTEVSNSTGSVAADDFDYIGGFPGLAASAFFKDNVTGIEEATNYSCLKVWNAESPFNSTFIDVYEANATLSSFTKDIDYLTFGTATQTYDFEQIKDSVSSVPDWNIMGSLNLPPPQVRGSYGITIPYTEYLSYATDVNALDNTICNPLAAVSSPGTVTTDSPGATEYEPSSWQCCRALVEAQPFGFQYVVDDTRAAYLDDVVFPETTIGISRRSLPDLPEPGAQGRLRQKGTQLTASQILALSGDGDLSNTLATDGDYLTQYANASAVMYERYGTHGNAKRAIVPRVTLEAAVDASLTLVVAEDMTPQFIMIPQNGQITQDALEGTSLTESAAGTTAIEARNDDKVMYCETVGSFLGAETSTSTTSFGDNVVFANFISDTTRYEEILNTVTSSGIQGLDSVAGSMTCTTAEFSSCPSVCSTGCPIPDGVRGGLPVCQECSGSFKYESPVAPIGVQDLIQKQSNNNTTAPGNIGACFPLDCLPGYEAVDSKDNTGNPECQWSDVEVFVSATNIEVAYNPGRCIQPICPEVNGTAVIDCTDRLTDQPYCGVVLSLTDLTNPSSQHVDSAALSFQSNSDQVEIFGQPNQLVRISSQIDLGTQSSSSRTVLAVVKERYCLVSAVEDSTDPENEVPAYFVLPGQDGKCRSDEVTYDVARTSQAVTLSEGSICNCVPQTATLLDIEEVDLPTFAATFGVTLNLGSLDNTQAIATTVALNLDTVIGSTFECAAVRPQYEIAESGPAFSLSARLNIDLGCTERTALWQVTRQEASIIGLTSASRAVTLEASCQFGIQSGIPFFGADSSFLLPSDSSFSTEFTLGEAILNTFSLTGADGATVTEVCSFQYEIPFLSAGLIQVNTADGAAGLADVPYRITPPSVTAFCTSLHLFDLNAADKFDCFENFYQTAATGRGDVQIGIDLGSGVTQSALQTVWVVLENRFPGSDTPGFIASETGAALPSFQFDGDTYYYLEVNVQHLDNFGTITLRDQSALSVQGFVTFGLGLSNPGLFDNCVPYNLCRACTIDTQLANDPTCQMINEETGRYNVAVPKGGSVYVFMQPYQTQASNKVDQPTDAATTLNNNDYKCAAASFLPNSTITCGTDKLEFEGNESKLVRPNEAVSKQQIDNTAHFYSNSNTTSNSEYYHVQSIENSISGANFRQILTKPLEITAAASDCDNVQSGGATVTITPLDQSSASCLSKTVSWNYFSTKTIFLPPLSYSVVLQQYNRFPQDTRIESSTRSSEFFGPLSQHTKHVTLVDASVDINNPKQISWQYYATPTVKTLRLVDTDGNSVAEQTTCKSANPPIDFVIPQTATANYTLTTTYEEIYAYGQTCEYLTFNYTIEDNIDSTACSGSSCSGQLQGTSSIAHNFTASEATEDPATSFVVFSAVRNKSFFTETISHAVNVVIVGIRNQGGGPRAIPLPLNLDATSSLDQVGVPNSCAGIANLTATLDTLTASYLKTLNEEVFGLQNPNDRDILPDVSGQYSGVNPQSKSISKNDVGNMADKIAQKTFSDADQALFVQTASSLVSDLTEQAFLVLRKPPGDHSFAKIAAAAVEQFAESVHFAQSGSVGGSAMFRVRFGVDKRGVLTVTAPFGIGGAVDTGAVAMAEVLFGLGYTNNNKYSASDTVSGDVVEAVSWLTSHDNVDTTSGWWIDSEDDELFGSPRDLLIFTPAFFSLALSILVTFDAETCSVLQTPIPTINVDRPQGKDDWGAADYVFLSTELSYSLQQYGNATESLEGGTLTPDEEAIVRNSLEALQCEIDYLDNVLTRYEATSKVAVNGSSQGFKWFLERNGDGNAKKSGRLTDVSPILPQGNEFAGDSIASVYDKASSIANTGPSGIGTLFPNSYYNQGGSGYLPGEKMANHNHVKDKYFSELRPYDIQRLSFAGDVKYNLVVEMAYKRPGIKVNKSANFGTAVDFKFNFDAGGGVGPAKIQAGNGGAIAPNNPNGRRRRSTGYDPIYQTEINDDEVNWEVAEKLFNHVMETHTNPYHKNLPKNTGEILSELHAERRHMPLGGPADVNVVREKRRAWRRDREQERITRALNRLRDMWVRVHAGEEVTIEETPTEMDVVKEHLHRHRREYYARNGGGPPKEFERHRRWEQASKTAISSYEIGSVYQTIWAGGSVTQTGKYAGGFAFKIQKRKFGVRFTGNYSGGSGYSIQGGKGLAIGLHLEDRQPGDSYDFNIFADENGMPVYQLNAGQTMCVHYPKVTFQRQKVIFNLIDGLPADRSNQPVLATKGQVFKFRIRSDGTVDREHTDNTSVYPITTRRSGLVFKINGDFFRSATQGRDFNWRLNRQEYTDIWLEVTLDPNADVAGVFEDVQIRAEPSCDRTLQQNINIAVNLVPACPSIQVEGELAIPKTLGRDVYLNNAGGSNFMLILTNPECGKPFESWGSRFTKAIGSNLLQTGIDVSFLYDTLEATEPQARRLSVLYAVKSANDPCTEDSALIACWTEDKLEYYLGSDSIDASQVPSQTLPTYSISLASSFIQIEVRAEDLAAAKILDGRVLLSASSNCESQVQSAVFSGSDNYPLVVDLTNPTIDALLAPAEEDITLQGKEATTELVLQASESVNCTFTSGKLQLKGDLEKGPEIPEVGVECEGDIITVYLPLDAIANALSSTSSTLSTATVHIEGLRDIAHNPLLHAYELDIPIITSGPGAALLLNPPEGVPVVLRGRNPTPTIEATYSTVSLACMNTVSAVFKLTLSSGDTVTVNAEAVGCSGTQVTVGVPVLDIEQHFTDSTVTITAATVQLADISNFAGLGINGTAFPLTVDGTAPTLTRILLPSSQELRLFEPDGSVSYTTSTRKVIVQLDENVDCMNFDPIPSAVVELLTDDATVVGNFTTGVLCQDDIVTILMPLDDISALSTVEANSVQSATITVVNLYDRSGNNPGDIVLLPGTGFTVVPVGGYVPDRRRRTAVNGTVTQEAETTDENTVEGGLREVPGNDHLLLFAGSASVLLVVSIVVRSLRKTKEPLL
eukprot:Clim_evm16s208 gene=Clim_evmTU16s208